MFKYHYIILIIVASYTLYAMEHKPSGIKELDTTKEQHAGSMITIEPQLKTRPHAIPQPSPSLTTRYPAPSGTLDLLSLDPKSTAALQETLSRIIAMNYDKKSLKITPEPHLYRKLPENWKQEYNAQGFIEIKNHADVQLLITYLGYEAARTILKFALTNRSFMPKQ